MAWTLGSHYGIPGSGRWMGHVVWLSFVFWLVREVLSSAKPGGEPAAGAGLMTRVPRTFRRESRMFLWVALVLILFLNLVTLFFFRRAVDWGSESVERRGAEVLRRLTVAPGRPEESAGAPGRVALERDVVYVAAYDAEGRRVRSFGAQIDAPDTLPTARPRRGEVAFSWRRDPTLLIATSVGDGGYVSVAIDPGPGAALRSLLRALTLVVPLAGAALVVLAGFYLRSLLAPYDRLLAAAGRAPGPSPERPALAGESGDEREFLIGRFESTIAALREKERELQARADDLETAAHLLSRNLPTGVLSVGADQKIVDLNESGQEILRISGDLHGRALLRCPGHDPGLPGGDRRSLRHPQAGGPPRDPLGRGRRVALLRRHSDAGRGRGRPLPRRAGALHRPDGDAASSRRGWRSPATSRSWERSPPAPRTSSATPPRRSTGSRTSLCAPRSEPPST